MAKKTVEDIKEKLKGKRVLVRCDFNVPMKDGEIVDDTRIAAALPTIRFLMENGAKVILCSHSGKPKKKFAKAIEEGKTAEEAQKEVKEKLSLAPVANDLSDKLNTKVKFIEDLDNANEASEKLSDGEVALLENTRFDPREEKNDDTLSLKLSELTDGIFVNDAFGSAHRAHSSTVGVASHVEEAVQGFLMQKEVEELGAILDNPQKPFVAILGGAKVSDKIGVINALLEKVNELIIGGAMANTFLKAKGYDIGDSLYEEAKLEEAEKIMKLAAKKGVKLVLPVDVKIAKEATQEAETKNVSVKDGISEGWKILDVGIQSINCFATELEDKKTILWNGPLGMTEVPQFAKGTEKIARFIAGIKNARCVIGGGDSVAAVNKIKKEAELNGEDISQFNNIYLSTGGGASLEFLEGIELPGVKCIQDKGSKQKQKKDESEEMVVISKEAYIKLCEFAKMKDNSGETEPEEVIFISKEAVEQLCGLKKMKDNLVGAKPKFENRNNTEN